MARVARWWAFVGALLGALAPVDASAQAIATGPGGELSVWRVLAEGRGAPSDDTLTALDPDECDDCRAVAQPTGRLDLRDATRRGVGFIALGVVVETETATSVHLFGGVDGEAKVLVDGQLRATWIAPRVIEDEHHLALDLSPGRHRLVIAVEAHGRSWSLAARLLGHGFEPGVAPATIDLGDRPLEGDALAALRSDAIRVRESVRLAPRELRVHVGFPGGGPTEALRVGRDGATVTRTPVRGAWGGETTSVFPIPESPTRGGVGTLVVDGRDLSVGSDLRGQRGLLRWGSALATRTAPPASEAPIRWRLDEIRRVLNEGERDRRWVRWLEREAHQLVRAIDRGDDPFDELSGYVRMAHPSRLDGSAQPYELFVPTGRRRGRDARDGWALVVTLHGFKGNAGDYFRNTFGLPRNYEASESLEAHGRHGTAPTQGPMVVIAPQARGQSMYRHMGEVDILEAIADVRSRLPIDPTRIYVTGGSMGGTGAAYLPLRNPDLFAAAAPLAGYHDQRVRQDTHHEGLSAVERFLMARLSDVDWAENAAHLPMLLVRGQRDRPLEWTRNLVRRLRELRYSVEHREPDLRHNVWTETYADGAIFDWFDDHQRPVHPNQVRLRTARERTRRAWWVEVHRRRADAFGEVDARVEGGRIEATTENLARVVFSPPTAVLEGDTLSVTIDGQRLSGPRPLTLTRTGERWRVGGPVPAPLGRPMRDVFHDPLVFVVGTRDPRHTAMNRRVAAHWARPRGIDVRYPIVDDVEVTERMKDHATLVLIGPPSSNAVLAPIAEGLPIRFESDAIRLDDERFGGPEIGAAFRTTWPGQPTRSLLVIAGPSPLGTWRSRFLPEVLGEYAIFDQRVANARGEMTCGGVKRDRVTGAGVGATANDTEHGAVPVDCSFRAHGFLQTD